MTFSIEHILTKLSVYLIFEINMCFFLSFEIAKILLVLIIILLDFIKPVYS